MTTLRLLRRSALVIAVVLTAANCSAEDPTSPVPTGEAPTGVAVGARPCLPAGIFAEKADGGRGEAIERPTPLEYDELARGARPACLFYARH